MNTTDDEQPPLQRIAGLPREIQPRKDLWPGIALRIDSAPKVVGPAARRFPAWPAAIAASLIVAFSAGLLLTRPWQADSRANSEANPAGTGLVELADVQGVAETEPVIFTQRSTSESEYVAAFREFLAIHPAPGPETALAPDWIVQTRGVLRQTETELAAALRHSPDDPLLQQRMAALRAYQLEWLKQMAAAERNSRRTSI
jgi:hypothetical protein